MCVFTLIDLALSHWKIMLKYTITVNNPES